MASCTYIRARNHYWHLEVWHGPDAMFKLSSRHTVQCLAEVFVCLMWTSGSDSSHISPVKIVPENLTALSSFSKYVYPRLLQMYKSARQVEHMFHMNRISSVLSSFILLHSLFLFIIYQLSFQVQIYKLMVMA